jgi:hypothetical protein
MRHLCAIIYVAVYNNSFAGKEFNITPVAQSQTQWCWAACSEMILNAYQYWTSQQTIANWAVNGANVTNVLSGTSTAVDCKCSLNSRFDSVAPGRR